MAPEVIRLTEGVGQEGLWQTEGLWSMEGIGMTEGPGHMEGPEKPSVPVSRPAVVQAAPKKSVRADMPGMRSAVVWAEILGKPKALRGKR